MEGIQYINLHEAVSLHGKSGVLFIDSRTPEEYRAGHIPGAVLLSRKKFEEQFLPVEDRLRMGETLVVYCSSRRCEDSGHVASRLANLGFGNIRVFEGGWAEWRKRQRYLKQ